jgi:hypothetical protein
MIGAKGHASRTNIITRSDILHLIDGLILMILCPARILDDMYALLKVDPHILLRPWCFNCHTYATD